MRRRRKVSLPCRSKSWCVSVCGTRFWYPEYMAGTRAFHHAARAIAYAAKGETENAHKEQAIFLEKSKLVPKDEVFGNNTEEAILALTARMVEGEILIREDKLEAGVAQLRKAIM